MDTINLTQLALCALGAVSAALGWFARELYGATQTLRRDLATLEVKLTTDYVRYDRLQDALKPVLEAIRDLNDKWHHPSGH